MYYTRWKLVFKTQNCETGVCSTHTGNFVFRAQNCETGVCVLHTLETCVQDPEQ